MISGFSLPRFSKPYRLLFSLAFFCFVLASQARSATPVDYDALRKAMRDEIQRTLKDLHVESLQKPYYVEYTLHLRHATSAKATLGTMLDRSTTYTPRLTVGIRVGSPAFDNTNFFDVGLSFFGSSDDEENYRNRREPQELDYGSLRHDLWLATDACYKQAVELYAKKQSAVNNRAHVDTTPDFSYLAPVKVIDTVSEQSFDRKRYEELVLRLSSIFNDFPRINSSTVNVEYLPETTLYVNSEGREYIKTSSQIGIEIVASTQATDGMPLAETFSAYAHVPEELPSYDSLARATRAMASTLNAQLDAPTIDAYSGPVLFEGQAAAEVFAQSFAPYVCAQRQPLSDRGVQDNDRYTGLQNKIGARVMAEFLSVQSNPLLKSIAKTPVWGSYSLDDDGVAPQPLSLVEDGYLKTLLSSRNPTKKIRVTNGRQRGGAPMIDVLELSAPVKKQSDRQAMLKTMMKILKKRSLPYGYIVRRALNQNLLYTSLYAQTQGDYPYSLSETTINLLDVYRVYPDGHEELVRGTQAAGMAPSQFKEVLAVGQKPYVYNYLAPAVTSPYVTGGSQYLPCTLSVPDLLFEDVEIRPLDGDFPKPPLLASPLQEHKN